MRQRTAARCACRHDSGARDGLVGGVQPEPEFRLARCGGDRGPRSADLHLLDHFSARAASESGPAALAEQLGALIDHSASSGISVRVVPFKIESLPGPSENFVHIAGPVPELDTVQIDISFGCPLFDAPADLASYREILDRMAAVALSEDHSRDFIRSIKKEIEGNHE
ncbi:Scr1 family TA system antitoxin-like transcriptional regulator [Kitasatospora sp. NPDC089509]|uniref:Scr1 family TA system antitoxin-like transcriptional regulator n=1 Tax=Kitasatospora sp. NPDC089509 TaxID=3364079 RepID=UPI0038098187